MMETLNTLAHGSVYYEISLLLLISVIGGYLGMFLRQPLVVSFIMVGILVGPSFLNIAQSSEFIELLAHLGISLLLFIVGLKLDLQLIRTTGAVAALTGLGQVVFTSVIGFAICMWMGYSIMESTYISVGLTFSSTIIIVKLLSDKGEADSLHGRVALGLLIVQDLVVVLVMIGLSAFGGQGESPDIISSIGFMLLKGFLLLGGVAVFMRYIVDKLLLKLAHSQELMVLFAASLAVVFSAFCDWMGFSKELGAFLAGISLASTQYREMISSRLKGLRDFMLLFFFIGLGSHIELSTLESQLWPAILLSLFVLIGNPIIMMAIMLRMGYRVRTSFVAGVAIAQISEFSLILLALGLQLGHISNDIMGLVTLVGLITIALSTYLIMYSSEIYNLLDPWLSKLEKDYASQEPGSQMLNNAHGEYDAILFGLGRYGSNIARGLRQNGVSVLGVDFDPSLVRQWQRQGHPATYGDANDTHFPETLPLDQARWVISALPPPREAITEDNLQVTLIHALRTHKYGGKVAVTAHTPSAVNVLRRAGADLVLLPFHDAAASAVNAIISSPDERDARQASLQLEMIEKGQS
ncbi:MAG: cation:proton antiporter [Rickettsiales bacterium]